MNRKKLFLAFSVMAAAITVSAKTLSDAEKHHSTEMNKGPAATSFVAGDVRIGFIGNSITLHGPSAKIGWTNNWGMAASTAENDYVHLVTRGIERATGRKAAMKVQNLAQFERNFRTYDFGNLSDFVTFAPEYLVIAIGENVPDLQKEEDFVAYREAFVGLLDALTKVKKPEHLLVRGVYWPNPRKDAAMRAAAERRGIDFVRADCFSETTKAGTNLFWHAGVANHPGDVGMRKIADIVLDRLLPEGALTRPRDVFPTSELRFRLDTPVSGFVNVGCVREGKTEVAAPDWFKFTVTCGERDYRVRPYWKEGRIEKVVFTDIRDSDGAGTAVSVKDFKVVDTGAAVTVDTKKFDGVVFEYAAPKFDYAMLKWTLAGEGGEKELPITLMPDGKKHAYWFDLSKKGTANWRGVCNSFDVLKQGREYPGVNKSLPVGNVRFVKGTPDLPPDPVIIGTATKEAIARAGRPLDLEVVVRNLGTKPVTNVRFTLDGLPNGVRVLSGLETEGVVPASTGESSVRSGAFTLVNERLCVIRLSDPGEGEFKITLTLTADGVEPRSAEVPVKVSPSLGLAAASYVPEPKPVKTGKYEIGAFLFPGWAFHSFACIWSNELERKPLLGWYDETKPETIDWQIKQLVENGISFVSVDWYWHAGESRRLNHWMKAFRECRYRRFLKWHMMWANHNPKGSHSVEDQVKVTRHWIDNYFNMPEYQKQDGKPIVAIWSPWGFERDLGPGGCRRALDISREEAKKAGYPGIHFIWMRWPCGRVDAKFLKRAADYGFDECTTYKYCGVGSKDMPLDEEGGIPFSWVADSAYEHYRTLKANSPVAIMPNLSTGYDDRPWRGEHGWRCSNINAKDFKRMCEAGRRFADETGVDRMILAPIDEWGEGSIGYPNAELGWGIFEAVRDTFGEKPADGWPVNCAPEDVGLACPQFVDPYVKK